MAAHPIAKREVEKIRSRSGPSRREWVTAIIALTAAFIAYAVVWPQAPLLSLDTPVYMQLAREIKAGNITELSTRTPGFPVLLILTGSEDTAGRALYCVQLLLYLSAVGFSAWLLRWLDIDRRLVLGMLATALLPPFVEPCAHADSEALCQFMVVAATASVVTWRITGRNAWLWVFSFAALGAAFVRPTYQFLVPAVAVALFALPVVGVGRHDSLGRLTKAMLVPVAVSVCGLGSYAGFNYAKFGYFDTSAMTPYTLSTKTASFVECLPDEYAGVREILLKHRDRELLRPFEDHTAQGYIHRAMPEIIQLFDNEQVKALRAVKQANLYLISRKPMSYLIESLKSMTTYWMPAEYELSSGDSVVQRLFWVAVQIGVVVLLFFLAIVLTGVGTAYVATRVRYVGLAQFAAITNHQITAYVITLTVIGYAASISCFAGMGIARYRVTSELVILICCTVGLTLFRRVISFTGTICSRASD